MADEDPIEEEYEDPPEEEGVGYTDDDPEFEREKRKRERNSRIYQETRAKEAAERLAQEESSKPAPNGAIPIATVKETRKTGRKKDPSNSRIEESRANLFKLAAEINRNPNLTEAQKIAKLAESTKFARFVELVDIGLHSGGNVGRAALERVSWEEDGKPATKRPVEDDDLPGVIDDIPE